MFYVPRQPNDEKADWVSLIKDRYICRLKEIDGVAPEFLKFVSDKNNIKIKRRSKFVFCDEYDVEMSYRITVSSQSVVSDGYKVETEERWGGDTDVYLREQTRTVTTSTSDDQCYRFSKRFVTKPVSGKNIVIDKYGVIPSYYKYRSVSESEAKRLLQGMGYNAVLDVERAVLENLYRESLYDTEIGTIKRVANETVRGTGVWVSSFMVTNIWVHFPSGQPDIYFDYDYEIEVVYGGKSYGARVTSDDYVDELDAALSAESKQRLERKAKQYKNKMIAAISMLCTVGALPLVMFALACVYGSDLSSSNVIRWAGSMPVSLINFVPVCIHVWAGCVYIKRLKNLSKCDNFEGWKSRSIFESEGKKERLDTVVFYLFVVISFAWTIVQAVALVLQ